MYDFFSHNSYDSTFHPTINHSTPLLLCKIHFTIPHQSSSSSQFHQQICVYANSTVEGLARQLGEMLGVGYDETIEKVIVEQLCRILISDDKNLNKRQKQQNFNDGIWEHQMIKVIETTQMLQNQLPGASSINNKQNQIQFSCRNEDNALPTNSDQISQEDLSSNQILHISSVKQNTPLQKESSEVEYFKNSTKLLRHHLQSHLREGSMPDLNRLKKKAVFQGFRRQESFQNEPKSLYDRSLMQLQGKKQKVRRIQRQQEQRQFKQCTFVPKINQQKRYNLKKSQASNENSLSFFKKPQFIVNTKDHLTEESILENSSFLKQETKKPPDEAQLSRKRSQSRFQRLYRDAFDQKNRRLNKIKKSQKDEQKKISALKFVPEINDCSRQICKAKSQSILHLSNIPNNNEESYINNEIYIFRDKENKNGAEFRQKFPFKPEISLKSRQIAERLPSFQEKLDRELKIIKNSNENRKKDERQKSKSCKNLSIKHTVIPHNTKQQRKNNTNKQNEDSKRVTLRIKKETYFIDDQESLLKEINLKDNEQKPESYKTQKNSGMKIKKENGIEKKTQKKMQNSFFDKQNEEEKQNFNLWTPKHKEYSEKSASKAIETASNTAVLTKNTGAHKKYHKLEEERRFQIFQQIFYYLISNPTKKTQQHHQFTASTMIAHPSIPQNIYRIFEPLLLELQSASQEWGQELSFTRDQFIWAVSQLYEGLSMNEKGTFLAWGIKLVPEN